MNTAAAETRTDTGFINPDLIRSYLDRPVPDEGEFNRILDKARELKGLNIEETAALLLSGGKEHLKSLMDTAAFVKKEIYGRRLVLFAPLYTGNACENNCTYCAFRADNRGLKRVVLDRDQIRTEVESLVRQGHKRLLMLCGESGRNSLDYFMNALETAYSVKIGNSSIRRINVEIAPLEVDEFRRLKTAQIGTYTCFQETYDPDLYRQYHQSGPKSDYLARLTVMDRAMEGGIDDVGIGALFGLADYRFEVLALHTHAAHLEENFGCGPHTISVPRIEPAHNAPTSSNVPYPVTDDQFKELIAILRISMPYTGIILTTRESEALRNELFAYGVSQISAGSRTDPGAYAKGRDSELFDASQFSLGDHRNLDEVISRLIDGEYIPSFCTGCYRKGRVGQDFMDMAKPGLIKEYCMPNGAFTFAEYLMDYASDETREKGLDLLDRIIASQGNPDKRKRMTDAVRRIAGGERDIYY
jgi:2-iminoacetate synthase